MEEKVNEVKELKGYYIAEVPTGFANTIALNGEAVSPEELLIKTANALLKAGLMDND